MKHLRICAPLSLKEPLLELLESQMKLLPPHALTPLFEKQIKDALFSIYA